MHLDIPYKDLQYILPQGTGLRTQTDNYTHAVFLFRDGIENLEGTGHIGSYESVFLDLDGIKNSVFLDDEVDLAFEFDSLAVAVDLLLILFHWN